MIEPEPCMTYVSGGPPVWWSRPREVARLCYRCQGRMEDHPVVRVETWSTAGPYLIPETRRNP